MKWILILIPIVIIGLVFAFNIGKKPDDNNGYEGTGGSRDYTNPDAPKTIESKEIISFLYTFSTPALNQWEERDIPYERCNFELIRQEDQVLYKGRGYGYHEASFDFEIELSLSVLEDLDDVVVTNKVANSNGIYKEIIGIPEDDAARLRIKYASGETISAYDNSGHVLTHSATLALYDFLVALAKSVDENLI